MRPIEAMRSAAVDRRTFLMWMPRYVFDGVKELMADVSSASVMISHGAGPEIRRRVATIDIARCLAWEASECQLCYLRCPLRNEAIVLDGGTPTIVAQACDGCGVCVEACRAVNDLGAIHVVTI